jgi:N-acetylmuramic acid 6-phosphate etherase
MKSITESASLYNNLEKMSSLELLISINKEDKKIARATEKAIPQIEKFVDAAVLALKKGGRLFYIGAGTSGRLGILDASEILPTFGVKDKIIGIIAGGDAAIRNPIENAEDAKNQAWYDLEKYKISEKDVLLGIASSGTTPYVIGGIEEANKMGLTTGCIVCNKKTRIAAIATFPIEVILGPEFVTGSTRMKAGTATKMVLNMISTSIMIKLGRVQGNKMVDMQLTNEKLINRGVEMVAKELNISKKEAEQLLEKYKSVRGAIENGRN